jgi:hypothetical protein
MSDQIVEPQPDPSAAAVVAPEPQPTEAPVEAPAVAAPEVPVGAIVTKPDYVDVVELRDGAPQNPIIHHFWG